MQGGGDSRSQVRRLAQLHVVVSLRTKIFELSVSFRVARPRRITFLGDHPAHQLAGDWEGVRDLLYRTSSIRVAAGAFGFSIFLGGTAAANTIPIVDHIFADRFAGATFLSGSQNFTLPAGATNMLLNTSS